MRIMQRKLAVPEPRRSIVPGSGVLTGGRGTGVPPPGGMVKPPPKPGDTPKSPVRVVAPVLVTVEAPRTEKVVRSAPRIPSAFALGTEKEKIAKDRIRRKKSALFYALLKYLCAGHDVSRQEKICSIGTDGLPDLDNRSDTSVIIFEYNASRKRALRGPDHNLRCAIKLI